MPYTTVATIAAREHFSTDFDVPTQKNPHFHHVYIELRCPVAHL